MTKQLKLILGFALFIVMTSYWASASWYSIRQLISSSDCGLETKLQENKVIIAEIKLNNYSPILHTGDEIVGILGMEKGAAKSLLDGTVKAKPGSETVLLVKCQGEVHKVPIVTQSLPTSEWIREISGTFAPWTFMITGLLLFLLRSNEPQAWLLSIMLGAFIGLFNVGFDPETTPKAVLLIDSLAHIAGIIFIPLFAFFFLIFPDRDAWLTRWPRLVIWIFLPFLVLIFPINTLGHLQPYSNFIFESIPAIVLSKLNLVFPLVFIGYLLLGLIALIRRYRFSDQSARRKLQLIVAGCSLGIVNVVLIISVQILDTERKWTELYAWLQLLTNFTLPLIPISFAYAIIKHQVIPISLIIRRGMRYMLVARGSVLVEIAIFSLILSAFLTFFFRWLFANFRPQSLDSLGMTIGVVSALVGIVAWNTTRRLHHKYLSPIIDRKFFRQSYDSHQIITGLAESLRTTSEQAQLLEEVASKLQFALQTESVGILLRNELSGDFHTTHYCEYSPRHGGVNSISQTACIRASSEIVRLLGSVNKCRAVSELLLTEEEEHSLQQLKAEILLPLSGKDQMLGIITLGPRLGDLPFSREDEELLMSVANPVAFAIDNARLVERMINEARRREEIEAENEARAKELEEARQLQLSMLPKKIPQLPQLEIAAYMKTATEVGGDYYDFHLNSNNTLTIAVGDATGHGLKAGTVVTAMKSLFRTFAPGPELVSILTQSSRVLKDMNLRSLFMAMLVVRIEGYQMRISAAGMPPVLIYRALTGEIEEVFIKAVPLGSVRNYPWREEVLTIDPDDVVLLMSDGFPERFNSNQEMLGYDKAVEVLKESAMLKAEEIIERFIKLGDEWADGLPQDDDITFVVVKVK